MESYGEVPTYDWQTRELLFQGRVVLSFRQPAEYQAAVLRAFERMGWPPVIPNPLTDVTAGDPRKRINDTVHRLSRRCRPGGLEFYLRGDGFVRWRPCAHAATTRR